MVFHFTWDGANLTHKFNPHDQVCAPENMELRSREELKYTTKGSHERNGSRSAHFICPIAYGKGTALAEQYFGNWSGKKFADFVCEHFSHLFARNSNEKGKLFLHHKIAKDAIYIVGGKIFSIPPRSLELNPIGNVFNNVKVKFEKRPLRDTSLVKTLNSFHNVLKVLWKITLLK